MGLSLRRRRLIWVLYAVLLAALFEGLSAILVLFILPAFKPYYLLDFYNEQAAEFDRAELAAYARDRFDPDLGWDTRPNRSIAYSNFIGATVNIRTDAIGARDLPAIDGPNLIAAYGDSFTYGSDVSDDETWSYFLSQMTGKRVANFGVVAYGPDQALLKIERNFRRGIRSPIVVLAMISENINRLVNVYRPFYARKEPGPGFKPMFSESGGAVELVNLVPQPLRTQAEYQDAIDRAKPYDYWYLRHASMALAPRFPHAWQSLRIAARSKPVAGALWQDPGALAILRYLLERFRAHAAANGYLPILVFIPRNGEELTAGRPPGEAEAVARIMREFAGGLAVIDLVALAAGRSIDPERYNLAPNFGHLSPYGNEMVARLLHEQLSPWIERVGAGALP